MISEKGEELFQNWVCQSVLQYNTEALNKITYLYSKSIQYNLSHMLIT